MASPPATAKQHPIFARVDAPISPAMDAQGALEHRRASSPAWPPGELHRVLGPGGEVRFFEHVQADIAGLARGQRLADHLWPTLVGGCHTSRNTLAAISAPGDRSPASSGSGSPRAGCPSRPRLTSSASPTAPTSSQAKDGRSPEV